MTKEDIRTFIRIMKDIQEDWTEEEVEEKYGDCVTLKEAIDKRLTKINTFYDYVGETTRPKEK